MYSFLRLNSSNAGSKLSSMLSFLLYVVALREFYVNCLCLQTVGMNDFLRTHNKKVTFAPVNNHL